MWWFYTFLLNMKLLLNRNSIASANVIESAETRHWVSMELKEQCGTSDSVLKAFDFLFAFKTSDSQIQVLNSFGPIYVDTLKQTI